MRRLKIISIMIGSLIVLYYFLSNVPIGERGTAKKYHAAEIRDINIQFPRYIVPRELKIRFVITAGSFRKAISIGQDPHFSFRPRHGPLSFQAKKDGKPADLRAQLIYVNPGFEKPDLKQAIFAIEHGQEIYQYSRKDICMRCHEDMVYLGQVDERLVFLWLEYQSGRKPNPYLPELVTVAWPMPDEETPFYVHKEESIEAKDLIAQLQQIGMSDTDIQNICWTQAKTIYAFVERHFDLDCRAWWRLHPKK